MGWARNGQFRVIWVMEPFGFYLADTATFINLTARSLTHITFVSCKSMHYDTCGTLFTPHISQHPTLTGRGRRNFSRQQPARLSESGFHGTTSECRSWNSAASTTPLLPAKKSLSRPTYKSCLPRQSLVMPHANKLAQDPLFLH